MDSDSVWFGLLFTSQFSANQMLPTNVSSVDLGTWLTMSGLRRFRYLSNSQHVRCVFAACSLPTDRVRYLSKPSSAGQFMKERGIRPSRKKTNVSRPEFYKKESGRALFLLFPLLHYFQLNAYFFTHYYPSPGIIWSSWVK